MSKNATALAMALAVASAGVSPSSDEADPRELIHEALAVVGQDVPANELTIHERRATANAATNYGAVGVVAEDEVTSATIRHGDGMQVIAILEDEQTSTGFELTIPEGVEIVPASDGGFEFVIEDDGGRLVLGAIEAPWAVDAQGKMVDTAYELDGDRLIQHVDPQGAVYPIVADPKLTFGVGVYLNLWGWDIKAFNTAIVAAGGVAGLATCVSSRIPTPLVGLVRLACTAVGAPTIGAIMRAIQDVWRSGDVRTNACYQKRIVGAPQASPFYTVNTKNCS